ncbi:MAG: cation transporter [Armatimonadota bacterium]|nr:MAG: cation transporter [Armatimonadota bacterium]
MTPDTASAAKTRAALISVASNVFLTALKAAAGVATLSVSILSEALHSGLDLVAAVMALLAVRRSRVPADADHNFGHGKFESMSGLAEGVLILIAVGLIVWSAFRRLVAGEVDVRLPLLGLVVMGISAVANVFVSRMLFRVAEKTESVALEADAWHLRTDVWTSAGVLGGMAVIAVGTRVGLTEVHHLDPVIAIGVAVVIARAAWDITRRAYDHLVDRSLPAQEVEKIAALLRDHYPQLIGFHRLRTRQAGPARYVDLHVVVPGAQSVAEAHALADHLERDLEALLPRLEVMIHVEPREQNG